MGEHGLVKRMMKGIYEKRPAFPRYSETWDVNIVFSFFDKNENDVNMNLKELTLKLVLLMAIRTGQRCQTLQLLDINNMKLTENKCVFYIKNIVKQSRPNKHLPPIELLAYPANEKLCIVTMIRKYINFTSKLRQSETRLFISFSKPHKAVSTDTLARWIKTGLANAGIDTNKYSAHSTRAASVSAASQRGIPVDTIMKAAGWTQETTFSKFYRKKTDNMAQGLLDAFGQI